MGVATGLEPTYRTTQAKLIRARVAYATAAPAYHAVAAAVEFGWCENVVKEAHAAQHGGAFVNSGGN